MTNSITEEKKKKRRVGIVAAFPGWYPWVSLGLGGYGASGEQPSGEMPAAPAGGGEGGGASMGESCLEDSSIFQAPNYQKSMLIPRENMPQIASADLPEFFNYLGYEPQVQEVDPNRLAPSQGQFDMDKVDAMDPEAAQKPVVTSRDGYVLDGHHRWLSNAKNGKMQKVYVLPMSAQRALRKMNEFPGSFNKQLKEDFNDAISQTSVADRLARLSKKPMESLQDPHRQAIKGYSLESKSLTKALGARKEAIQGGKLTQYGITPDEARAEALSQSLHSFGEVSEPLTVYTGASSHTPPDLISQYSNGIFHHPGFISTSTNADVAARFASDQNGVRHVVKLDIPAGFKGGAFIRDLSERPEENEFLIDHNQIVKISHKIGEMQNHRGEPVHVWQGHILSDQEASEHAADNDFAHRELESHRSFKAKTFAQSMQDRPMQESQTKSIHEGAFESRREEMVKGMKKKKQEFIDKYGEDWKNVMYATATKIAKKETE